MRILTLLAVLNIGLTSGCITTTLGRDQDQIRCAILELYDSQITDNLVRASQGLPIVQVDYTNATGTVSFAQTASFSDSQVDTGGVTTALPALTRSIANTLSTTIAGSVGASHSNQVAITGTPVTTSNEVYDAYLQFLSIPGSLVVTPEPPPPGAAHVCKKCGRDYYWVPAEYKGDYFKLALLTTVRRGKSLLPADKSYSVNLQKVVTTLPGQSKHGVTLAVRIDKDIPNDDGYIKLSFGANTLETDVTIYEPGNVADAAAGPKLRSESNPDEHGQQPPPAADPNNGAPAETPAQPATNPPAPLLPPDQTHIVVITFKDIKGGPTAADLAKQFNDQLIRGPITASVFLRHYTPAPPNTDDLLQRSNFLLQQIQFGQLRGNGP